MKILNKLWIYGLLLGGLLTFTSHAQSNNSSTTKDKGSSGQGAANNANAKQSDATTPPGQTRKDSQAIQTNNPEKPPLVIVPEREDNSGKGNTADSVKKLIDEFKQARTDFLQEQKQLHQQLKEASEDGRAQLRAQIDAKKQLFLDQQRELRDEIKRRVGDLKDTLKDHRDVLDAAKESAKDQARNRKGGGD